MQQLQRPDGVFIEYVKEGDSEPHAFRYMPIMSDLQANLHLNEWGLDYVMPVTPVWNPARNFRISASVEEVMSQMCSTS